MLFIPLVIRRLDIKLPHQARKDDAKLYQHQRLPNTIPRPQLERPPRARLRMQVVAGGNHPALRQERIRLGPVLFRAMHFDVQDPEDRVVGGQNVARVVGDADALFPSASGAGGREEAHGFFDHGQRVMETVDEARVLGELRGCCCWFGA